MAWRRQRGSRQCCGKRGGESAEAGGQARSERAIGAGDRIGMSARVTTVPLVAEESLDLGPVEVSDRVAQLIEELEHGEGLVRRPEGADYDGGRPEGSGRRRPFEKSTLGERGVRSGQYPYRNGLNSLFRSAGGYGGVREVMPAYTCV